MIWLLIFAVPVCVELAGWMVDSSFAAYLLTTRHSGDDSSPTATDA
jgi:hypothetical protein